MNYQEFISKSKTCIIAPAGFGKTHAITECLKYTSGVQLILTHTHAGVASLKEKIFKQQIPPSNYRVETISSFAQKYVKAFYCGNGLPLQEDSVNYFPFIISKAAELFAINPIKDIIKTTYSGLFVDEYQDCTKEQHSLILRLSDVIPTHILGDPLQGIFGFGDQKLVDFKNDLSDFERFPDLSEPWRWKTNNVNLGTCLIQIRKQLENNEPIDLSDYGSAIEVYKVEAQDIYNHGSLYKKTIWSLRREDNVLLIHPNSTSINPRKNVLSKFNNSFRLLESIDDESFYNIADSFSKINKDSCYLIIYNHLPELFNGESAVNRWLKKTGPVKKRNISESNCLRSIIECFHNYRQSSLSIHLATALKLIEGLDGIKCYRKELFSEICRALEIASNESISVYDAMVKLRNSKRRNGHKAKGKCIGTTLLTKGLEFDTVAILDAQKFECPKHLYVALTRARKRLIVFTNNKILGPY